MFVTRMEEKKKANRLEHGTEQSRNGCFFHNSGVSLFLSLLEQGWELKFASTILVDAVFCHY